MATRLERLWVLLDSGSTPVTRKAAATQIGEIQKFHPHELNNLLRKVSVFLSSKSWETRIAAGQAVEAIATNVKQWDPQYLPKEEGREGEHSPGPTTRTEMLSFVTFDIKQVLLHGKPLLSSTGEEYQGFENDHPELTSQERLAFQRQQLQERLGLTAQGKVFSTGMEHLFDDNDLVTHVVPNSIADHKNGNCDKIRELSVLQDSGLSVRERNRAKRKARQLARRPSVDTDSIGRSDCDSPSAKKPKTSLVMVEQSGPDSNKVLLDQVADVEATFDETEEWPFAWFCEELFQNLFNPAWEVRHGAATALREVIKLHGKTAGICTSTPTSEREPTNQRWLVDVAIRLLCVFSLDRFADFLSDQVVAPVRATCAQALGIVARLMKEEHVLQMSAALLLLAREEQWEVRHASLMGMQHLLAARTDLSSVLVPSLFPCILQGVQDVDDDVRAVAAAALLPVSGTLPSILPQQVPPLLVILWDSLLELDDLSSSTNSIMELMGTLLSPCPLSSHTPSHTPSVAALQDLVPRLWPFLSHSISSVRKSSLQVILLLLNYTDGPSAREHAPNAEDHTPSAEGGGGNGEVRVQEVGWLKIILRTLLCQLFQRFALEGDSHIRQLLHKVWATVVEQCSPQDLSLATSPVIAAWLCIMVAPAAVPIDTNLIVLTSTVTSDLYLGGTMGSDSCLDKEQAAFVSRVAGTKALGLLASKMTPPPPVTTPHEVTPPCLPEAASVLLSHLVQLFTACWSRHRIVAALVVCHWDGCPSPSLHTPLLTALADTAVLEDVMPCVLDMQKDCQSLIMTFDRKGVNLAKDVTPSGYTVEFASKLATTSYQQALQEVTLSSAERRECDTLSGNVLSSAVRLQEEHSRLSTRVSTCVAGALVCLHCIPSKLNPVIRPFMDCIKTESDHLMQQLAGLWLSQLMEACETRTPCPNSKIMKNLCVSACCDPDHTPKVVPETGRATPTLSRKGKEALTPVTPSSEDTLEREVWSWSAGIISLARLQKEVSSRKPGVGRGRPSAAAKEAMANTMLEQEQRKVLQCQQRGAESALISLSRHYKDKLFHALPYLWDHMTEPLQTPPTPPTDEELTSDIISRAQSLISALHILEVIAPSLATPLHVKILSLLPCLLQVLCSPFTAIRHMSARAMCSLIQVDLHHTMQFMVAEVLPFLGATSSAAHRQGAIEVLSCVLEGVGLGVLCYVVLLLMPVLGTMSDQMLQVRHMATRCFGTLVTLMPLEPGAATPPQMSADLVERRQAERQFLEQLLDTSKIEQYTVPVHINADLRKYQQDGINWLAFLNKYKLHGILCDDMGLGKTLQSLCIIAGDHHHRNQRYAVTGQVDVMPLPSLIVCPPTLTAHWFYEVKKFCDPDDLCPLQYSGSPTTRTRLQALVPEHNLIIASYDIVRNDIEFFQGIDWNYCVLDEGHVIKNTKTKITKAVKQLHANHRLILSGTPIQNNVLELWSLFDFLLPGFLGTERQFYQRFGKPIILSRDAKSSSKEQEAGALAMEALHRQVLPFLLRRMKEDVLQDLPPKIIQDYQCELSSLQAQLYDDFSKSTAQRNVELELGGGVAVDSETPPTPHVFQALQYLRKVCNHPALVMSHTHPLHNKIQQQLKNDSSDIRDIKHSAKLQALRQLLLDCGIGGEETAESAMTAAAVSQHRALVFCQYKSMLDIIETDLFKIHMSSLTYLRLDGSTPAANRFETVHKFNSDPSVDVLLLTTHVGGLGLNLTGADTVIFFEHDWNPMKDLQAMDRAHRIGQKKVVNVYRLITKGTLEEKIMSLQRFKLNIANTVIGQEDSHLRDRSDLLGLFQVSGSQQQWGKDKEGGKAETEGGVARGEGGGLKRLLEGLPELWSEQQYADEYDLSGFIGSLSSCQ